MNMGYLSICVFFDFFHQCFVVFDFSCPWLNLFINILLLLSMGLFSLFLFFGDFVCYWCI